MLFRSILKKIIKLFFFKFMSHMLENKIDINFIKLKEIQDKTEESYNKIMNDCLLNNFQNIENTIKLIKQQFEEIKNNFLNELKNNIEEIKNNNHKIIISNEFKIENNLISFEILGSTIINKESAELNNDNNIDLDYKIKKEKKIEEKKENIKQEKKEEEKKELEFEKKKQQKIKTKSPEEIIEEIKKNLSNEEKIEFQPPMIEKNQLSISNALNEGIMEEDDDSSNFEFLLIDLEVNLNQYKGQVFDDENNNEILEVMKQNINQKGEINVKDDLNNNNINSPKDNLNNNLLNNLKQNPNIIKNMNNNNPKLKAIYQKYKNNIPKNELEDEIKKLDYKERNLIEFSCFYPNSNYYNTYNIYLKIKEKIDLDKKLPLLFSFINIPPFSYISGGRDSNAKELKKIIRIQRTGEKKCEYIEMTNLKKARSNHTSIYIPSLNSIAFISGSKTTSCEILNLNNNKIIELKDLHIQREGASPCLFNEKILYVFFGYNTKSDKYITSLEKLDLKEFKNKWEEITFKLTSSNMNLYQKQNLSCIPYSMNNKDGILLIGGIGNNGMESKEVLYYCIKTKSISVFQNLNFPSSYTHLSFINYGFDTYDDVYNLTNFGILIKYDQIKEEFTPIMI